ncbi:MAG: T9SS type A sorting domain-containing protein [Ignavibacteria bacterium]|nr:T9SS type A sorting domain-containing protein [Ignavibacteria bacterium]
MKHIIKLSLLALILIYFSFFNHYPEEHTNINNYLPISNFNKKTVPADEWFEKQRAFPFDEIPNEEYIEAIDYVKNHMSIGYISTDNNWALAGPTNIEGRITTIVIHPTNPQVVYAGCANGGVWKSTNFCQSWISVFDDQNTSSIGALAIDPQNPETIYCGTGEANSLRSYYPGTGIYKSTNGGNNWTFIGLDSSYSIGNISVNPSNPSEIYVAAVGSLRRKNDQRGIYKSTNGGTNWIRSLYIADSVGAIDVAVDSGNPSKVIAALWERQRREDYIKYDGPMTALYVSTNSGLNWNVISGGFPSNEPTLGRISLDISSSNSQIVYALTAYANGYNRGLYKSTDGAASWTLINSTVASSSSYAWFNRICKSDPSDPNIVYCGGLNMHKSNNGGTTFGYVSESHVDQHGVAFAPSNPNYVVIGNDGGIDYSTNGGSTWLYSNSLPVTQFYAGEINFNNPDMILGGTQDNGTVRTSGSVSSWSEIYGGDGFYCLVDYSNQMRVYASSQFGGLGRSTNGGASFMSATSGLDLTYTNWMTPFVMDKNNPLILYCGTYKIHKTTNGMQSWVLISPDLTNGHIQNLGTITTVDVSKTSPNVIYCGTDDANVWVTTNSGINWNLINSGLPRRWVTRVAVHPDSSNVCYVTLSGYKVDSTGSHIYKTSNYGTNWASIGGNLPDAPINDVLIDPNDTKTLFIATDVSVMYTNNTGTNWYVLGTGIPSNVPCHDLTLHNPSRKLIVWTHGRSALKITLPPIVNIKNEYNETPETFSLSQNYPNPFNPFTHIEYQLGKNTSVTLKIYDITGREVVVLISKYQQKGNYKIEFDGRNYSSGIYIYVLRTKEYLNSKRMMLIK